MSRQDKSRLDDTDHAIIQDIVDNELDPLLRAARSLLERETPGS